VNDRVQRQKQKNTSPKPRWFFGGILPINRAGAVRDILAGFTLAAMNMPQVLGYTRIAGTPVVTGLYTLLLPLVAFAALGSSRYLVVAADSATAAILAGRLSQMTAVGSEHYVALAGMVALLTAVALILARLFKLGFLSDFLSQTVLVGFLTGVGFQVGIAMLGELLRIPVNSNRTTEQLAQLVRGLPNLHLPTLLLAVTVVVFVLVLRRIAPRMPGPLFAVVGGIAASAAFDFSGHGIAVIQGVTGGLPRIGLPQVKLKEIYPLFPAVGSCFLMIVTQSAATARAYAFRHREKFNEDTDLVGLSAANAAAALSGAFVVNGSPTQTTMVERSGGRSQIAHLATAGVVAVVLLFLTAPLNYLPRCVLGAIVFTIAIGVIDIRGLLDIRRESPGEFLLAVTTAVVVVAVGVEQGILLAIVLSLLRHVRHSYRPYTAVLVEEDGRWKPTAAVRGARSAPGLVVFQFGADLFYANAERFADDVRVLVEEGERVNWLVLDAGGITSIDYSASRVLRGLQQELSHRGTTLLIVHADSLLRSDLHRHHLNRIIGADHIFDSLRDAQAAINEQRVYPAPTPSTAGGEQHQRQDQR
jgi:MFS superfamily sulfate permease-like transporter